MASRVTCRLLTQMLRYTTRPSSCSTSTLSTKHSRPVSLLQVYPQVCRRAHTSATDDVIATITKQTTLVSVNSLLYQTTAMRRLIDSMLELGFGESDITDLFLSTPRLLHCSRRQSEKERELEDAVKFFRGEGFSVRQTILILKRNPDVITAVRGISDVITFLRDVISLKESNLQEVLSSHPELMFSSGEELAENFQMLMAVFRRTDIMRMLRTNPEVLLQDTEEVTNKVNYVYRTMGLDQTDMVWANLMCHDLDHIRARHMFLSRAGKYEKPDKQGATLKPNPYLKDILGGTDGQFAKKVGLTEKEYHVFKKLLKVEQENKRKEFEDEFRRLGEDEKEDGDSDDELETQGYRREKVMRERRRKKVIE